ncbi:MAG: glycosyltransferase family 2 protein [Bacteroidota bacterium]
MVDISIVIVNYNVKQLLLQCLKSIHSKENEQLTIETIVIDNDSKDGSIAAVKDEFPNVILIENKFNAGFSGANNQGMSIAKGKFILLLNPDTEIIGDALPELVNYIQQNSCMVVAPQLLNSDGSIQASAWKNHTVLNLIIETFFLNKLFDTINYPIEQLRTTFEAKALSGAALFFKKELIDRIGMLDKQFFWMEDIDFCYRARQYGSLAYLHSAQIIHHSGQSQKKNYNISISNQLLSKLKYYKKHTTVFKARLAIISCFIFIVSRITIFTILSPLKELWAKKAQAYRYTFKRFFNYLVYTDTSII